MTEEVQNQIIGMFWEKMPIIIIFIIAGAILGIGYKVIEIKIMKKLKENKKQEKQKK